MDKTEENKKMDLFLDSKNRIEKQKLIIVGFDPGLTAGIAILDLSGNLIAIKSCKEIPKAEIIKYIIGYGKAVLIATDVYPPPKMVKKLATTLNSKIYSPDKTFTVSSKIELVESYLNEISAAKYPENAHERDALAAAIKTYKHYQNKLRQIEKRAEDTRLSRDEVEDVKRMVIMGTPITKAINSILKDYDEDDLEIQIEKTESTESPDKNYKMLTESIKRLKLKIKSQERQIKNLKRDNAILNEELDNYKDEVLSLEGKIEKVHYKYSKDILLKKEISSKIAIIKKLQEKYNKEKHHREQLEDNLRSIKKIRKMELSKKAVPVKIIQYFTKEGIREAEEYWKIKKGDTVLLSSTEGGGSQTALLLIKLGIKAVIAAHKMSHPAEEEFEKNMVPVLDADNLDLEIIDEFAVIDRNVLKDEIDNWKARTEDKKRKQEEEKLIKVMDEYRAQRKRL